MGSIQLGDGRILNTATSLEGVVLEEGKNSTDTILKSGSSINKARVERESV